MTPTPQESPEQWANKVWTDVVRGDYCVGEARDTYRKAFLHRLAAVKRDADAMRLWRDEALAGDEPAGNHAAWCVWNTARAARIAAGLE